MKRTHAGSQRSLVMTLISKWEISRSLQNFYTGNAPVWIEKTKQLLTIADEAVHIRHAFDADSVEKPYKIEIEGDGITAAAACNNGKTILTFSRSTLIRKWEREIVVKTSDNGTTEEIVWKQKQSWRGQGGFVTSACVDSSDSLCVTGSTDGSIRVWDINGGFCTHNFVGHTGVITRVKLHPRRLVVFSSAEDRTIKAWDLNTSAMLYSLEEHVGKVTDFDLSQSVCPTGPDHLISVANDQTVVMWEAAMGQMIFQVPIAIDSFAVTTLPREFAPLANDGKKFLQQFKTEEAKERAQKLRTRVPYVMLTGGEDGTLRMWDIATIPKDMREAKPVLTVSTPHAIGGAIGHMIRLSPDGQQLLTTGVDLSIAKWGLSKCATKQPTVERELIGHTPEYFAVKVTRPDVVDGVEAKEDKEGDGLTHSLVAFLTSDESLRLLDTKTMDVVSLRGHKHTIVALDVSPCGRYAATADKRGTAKLWSLASLSPIATMTGHVGQIGHISLPRRTGSYSGKDLSVLTAAEDKTVKMWRVPLGETNHTHSERVKAADRYLAACQQQQEEGIEGARKGDLTDVKVGFAGVESGLRRRWEGANQGVPANVVFPADLELLARAEEAGVHGSKLTKSDWTVVASQRDINALAVAPNDKLFATGGQDKLVRVFDYKTGKQEFELKGHTKAVWTVAFSPIDRILASGGGDRMIRLWNLVDKSLLRTLQGHDGVVSQLSFFFHKSPAANYQMAKDGDVKQDGSVLLMSGDNDGILKVWIPSTSTCVETADQHTDKIWALDTYQPSSTASSVVVTGGADGKLGLWKDVSRQEADRIMREKQDEVNNDNVVHAALRAKDYPSALRAALSLQRPQACRETLEAWLQSPLARMLENLDTANRGKTVQAQVVSSAVVVDDEDLDKFDDEEVDEETAASEQEGVSSADASEQEASSSSEEESTEDASVTKVAVEEGVEEYGDDEEARLFELSTTPAVEETKAVFGADEEADKDNMAMVRCLMTLDKKLLTRLVAFCADWASNSRHVWVATAVLETLIALYGANKLLRMVEGLADLAQKSVAYLARNSVRLSALKQKSFVLDLTLMDPQASSGWALQAFNATNEILFGRDEDIEEDEVVGAVKAQRRVIVLDGEESSDDE